MSVFYFHQQNQTAKDMAQATNSRGFIFSHRGELEFKIQGILSDMGHDIWPTCHTVISNIRESIDCIIPLDPADPLDAVALKIVRNKQPWCFVRVVNGPRMSTVIGYSSLVAQNAVAMSMAEQAQRGIIRSSYVPRAM